jgi:hypothetical protein
MSTGTKPRKLTPRQTQKMVAAYVERIYATHCTGEGKLISVLDIGKVFSAGATALWTAMREQSAAGVVPFDAAAAHDAVVAAMTSAFEQYRVRP